MFNFSITVTNIYFFLMVALAWLSCGQLFQETSERPTPTTSWLIILGITIVSFYGLIGEVHVLEGEYYFQETLSAVSERQYFKTLVLNDYLKETNPNPVLLAYYEQTISLILIQSLPTIIDKSSSFVIMKYLQTAGEDINSSDFNSQFVKAFIFGVTSNRLKAEEIFTKLAADSPYLPKIYLAWGDIYLFNNNPDKAKIKFEKAKSVLPSLDNIYLNNDQSNKLKDYYLLINNRLERANLLLVK
jgi:tetratricopeptide (TPR) repeat protein